MVKLNPSINYDNELSTLRDIYVTRPPQARLNIIQKKLTQLKSNKSESGANRLVITLSAVEALVRSMLVNFYAKKEAQKAFVYCKYRYEKVDSMVLEYLNLHNIDPIKHFRDDTWELFCHAIEYRNLIIHECTYLGQDKYPSLIGACNEILDELVKTGNLKRKQE